MEEAKQKYGVTEFMAGFSGGKDSVTALDIVHKLGKLYGVIYCDTGIGVQDVLSFIYRGGTGTFYWTAGYNYT